MAINNVFIYVHRTRSQKLENRFEKIRTFSLQELEQKSKVYLQIFYII